MGLSASNRAMASSIAARCASVQVSPLSVPATDRSRAIHAVETADADADTDAGRRRAREVLVRAGAMRVGAANARDVDAAITRDHDSTFARRGDGLGASRATPRGLCC